MPRASPSTAGAPPGAPGPVAAARRRRGWLLVLLLLPALAGGLRAAPDAEGDAVEALLAGVASDPPALPSTAALDALASDPAQDAWRLVEGLLVRGRADVAIALAGRCDEDEVGPIGAYAASPDAAHGAAERAAALARARASVDAGAPSLDTLKEIERARVTAGAPTVTGVEAIVLRGDLLAEQDRVDEALASWLRGGEEALSIGWRRLAEATFSQALGTAYGASLLDLAARAAEGVRSVRELEGDGEGVASTNYDLASIAQLRGDLPGALRYLEVSERHYEALKRPDDVASVRSLRSVVLAEMGDFAHALEDQRAVQAYLAERAHDGAWAEAQMLAGLVRYRLGDEEGAAAALERSREAFQALGDAHGEAQALGNLGLTLDMDERWAEAIAAYERALELLDAVDDPIGAATARLDVADTLRAWAVADWRAADREEDAEAARALRARADAGLARARKLLPAVIAVAEETGATRVACSARRTLAELALAEGRLDEAIEGLEDARDEAERIHSWSTYVQAMIELARARLRKGDAAGAQREARRASVELARATGGLAGDDLARARAMIPDAYDLGVSAAIATQSPDDLLYFLEAGRAAALLRGLGGRAVALQAAVPRALADRLEDRARAKVEAFTRWQAVRDGDPRVARELWVAYEALRAEEQLALEATLRAQDEVAARLAPSRLVAVRDVQARLRGAARPGLRQVFASFNLQETEASVLLVDARTVRIVTWPPEEVAPLRAALAALAAGHGELDPDALATARRLLVERLGIGPGRTRLLVSPDRDLAYVPLSALVPDDWEVAWEPSATTYDLLAEQSPRRGVAVLGLGDPDYGVAPDPDALATRGGPRLVPIPHTREEVEAITGQPADVRLLGDDATEGALVHALEAAGPEHPWKSVHLACHGLVDVELPEYSCLAITPGGGEDGFLTASEVLRLEMRTDLCVLSACQTGRGRFVRGEGVMSLTRAFMFAGAARVIVSLWDVDDAATSFLMSAFYRAWMDGRGTAEALRLAQIAVRDHEVERTVEEPGQPPRRETVRPWADPRYWAAWTLWGLAD